MKPQNNSSDEIIAYKVRRTVAKQSLKKASKLVAEWQEEEKLARYFFKRIVFLFCVLAVLIFSYWLIFN